MSRSDAAQFAIEFQIESFTAIECQRLRTGTSRELTWQHTHADQIRAMTYCGCFRRTGSSVPATSRTPDEIRFRPGCDG